MNTSTASTLSRAILALNPLFPIEIKAAQAIGRMALSGASILSEAAEAATVVEATAITLGGGALIAVASYLAYKEFTSNKSSSP